MGKPYLKQVYLEKVVPELRRTRGYSNVHQVPTLTKISINSAFKAEAEKAQNAEVVKEITKLTGQKPVITHARKSVASFKVRQDMPLGCIVTLRGDRMWDFLARLTMIALPMIRDFRGVSNRLDGAGNYSLGIADHTIFPETQADGTQRASQETVGPITVKYEQGSPQRVQFDAVTALLAVYLTGSRGVCVPLVRG